MLGLKQVSKFNEDQQLVSHYSNVQLPRSILQTYKRVSNKERGVGVCEGETGLDGKCEFPCCDGALTCHHNITVGTGVVGEIPGCNVRDITIGALFIGVFSAGTRLPTSTIIDVCFPGWVHIGEGCVRNDWDGILAVGNTNKGVQFAVDEICECLVSNLNGSSRRAEMRQGRLDELQLTRGNLYP